MKYFISIPEVDVPPGVIWGQIWGLNDAKQGQAPSRLALPSVQCELSAKSVQRAVDTCTWCYRYKYTWPLPTEQKLVLYTSFFMKITACTECGRVVLKTASALICESVGSVLFIWRYVELAAVIPRQSPDMATKFDWPSTNPCMLTCFKQYSGKVSIGYLDLSCPDFSQTFQTKSQDNLINKSRLLVS
jgi:hypothetical protein